MNANIEIGKGLTIAVDVDALREKPEAFGHVIYIGLRNILMDAHAGVKREDCADDAEYRARSLAQSQAKLDALMNNIVRKNAAGPRASAVDPIMAESLREARVFVGKKARGWEKSEDAAIAWLTAIADKIGHELPEAPTMDDWKALVGAAIKFRAEKPESIETAKKIVELRAATTVDVEI